MAHRIVWCSAATVDRANRPRSRVLHPIWEWKDGVLTGWVGTGPTATKRAHLETSPYISCNYWTGNHDTCVAECRAEWAFDLATRERIWNLFKTTAPPVGYDPAMIPGWEGPESTGFAVLRLTPWRLRVMPGTVLLAGEGEVLSWTADLDP
ncbi:MAG: pyridoxamine 5'-phosphate oxidase family protein [Acidobacteria bacterium]|nr:pyridoxamine 5'-phosphate oxidase family protein [Acidobacteriota bacterium]MXZ39376.1 pyridoxamine 5'-phosphate oxidase family protein [Holophagales bacterium]MYJ26064.1 pyridoxamine 5'-phosphate oxidase family protein [Holophagales bacterium]